MTDLAPQTRSRLRRHLRGQRIETPSWAYANSGTRFKVFPQEGVPRDPYEKIADAATVHRFTGVAPSVALHIPWDAVDDYADLARYARDQGITLGTVNSNVFQDNDYRLGSVTNPDPAIRRKAIGHLLDCVDIMDRINGADGGAALDLKLWFSDGTNYPGQDSARRRQDRLAVALRETYDRLTGRQRMLLEYKLFEPALYLTDVPDWGTAHAHCVELGRRAQVVIDTGHHAPGVNIEFIVAFLLRAGRLGGFDFNSRFYADDDLMVGAADPFQLFRIMHEIVQADALTPAPTAGNPTADDPTAEDPTAGGGAGGGGAAGGGAAGGGGGDGGAGEAAARPIAFMLDQCHNIEPKIPAIIRSVMNVQEATAKALLVDTDALTAAQDAGDVLGANAVLMDAYHTDVRPLLRELRADLGIDPDPPAAYARSGYFDRIRAARVGGTAAGWGA